MLNSIGPKTDFWGTPCITRRGDERVELTKIKKVRLVMNEDSHLCEVPVMHNDVKRC